jgi:hypothetical protein
VVAACVNLMILSRVLHLLPTIFLRFASGNNKIVGSIPSEFGGLTSLTSLRIFSECCSCCLDDMPYLLVVGCVTNFFLPSIISLAYWEEVSNTITGIIPTQLGDMTSLTGLYLGKCCDCCSLEHDEIGAIASPLS